MEARAKQEKREKQEQYDTMLHTMPDQYNVTSNTILADGSISFLICVGITGRGKTPTVPIVIP